MSSADREFDIVLWGVTGFTGRLVATTYARRYGLRNSSIKIGLAGRTLSRLEDVAQLMLSEALKSTDPKIKEDAKHVRANSDNGEPILPLIEVKDIQKGAKALCQRTHVIIALAGPFSQCGEPVVKAAAECGTDYVDITGELGWVKSMRDKYDSVAKANKARIIPCCGWDYLLNAVGVFCIQDYAKLHKAPPARVIDQLCVAEGSKPSGGTLRSMFNALSQIPLMNLISGKLPGPYQICSDKPSEEIQKLNSDVKFVRFSALAGRWMSPNVMTPSMKKYVHWMNEIQGHAYGEDFVFKVGEKSEGLSRAFGGAMKFLITNLVVGVASRFEFCAKRMAHDSGDGRATSELESKEKFVQVQTVGVVHPPRGEAVKVDCTITFDKGEAYMMTAWGVLESGITCLKARRGDYPSTNQYGVGCTPQLLGHAIIDQLKLAGFNIELKETTLTE